MKAVLSPSLLSANFCNLGTEIEHLQNAGITWLHLDVMDGAFVPNITFGTPVIRALRRVSNLFFDLHLMIENPERYLDDFAAAGADLIVVHAEATSHPQKVLEQIHSLGCRSGVALDPDTDISRCRWLLPYLDMAVVMGVNPGFSGQKFIPQTCEKVRECRAYLDAHSYSALPLQVDGGVNLQNAMPLVEAGASVLVSGSAFFKCEDYKLALEQFAKAVNGAKQIDEAALTNVISWRHID